MKRIDLTAVLLACAATGAAHAADDTAPPTRQLQPVVVTATRSAQSPYDVAATISVVAAPPDGALNVNLSEMLATIPGVLARDRQNYAQDEQLSIRGFGARSTFGIRGVRLYTDGIPASMPDGQGQVSHFNLGSADRVEVLRGPFSALYGNASGGVVQLFTADGAQPDELRFGLAGGSNGMIRADVGARGKVGTVDYTIDDTHFRTDGYRDHSAARRESSNAKLGWQIDDGKRLTLVLNNLDVPFAQDPLGLTRSQWRADPSQATSVASQYDTRKTVNQTQGGLVFDDHLDQSNSLRVMGYYGDRNVLQYLSIPKATQASQPGNSGGVVDLSNEYGGGDARWTWNGDLAGRPLEVAAGATYDNQHQHRSAYNDYLGDALGVRGDLRRDEIDRVFDFDQYAQATWKPTDRWTVMAGLRHSQVKFSSDDRYIRADNPDDSGSKDYSATTPVAGVMFSVNPRVHVYANYGKGFETPTFSELGYRNDGGAGLAFNLQPVHTRSTEVGVKLRPTDGTRAEFTLFRANSQDELAVATNLGGRTTYQNIDRSRRQGFEASLSSQLTDHLRLDLSYTRVQATFRSPFLTCVATGCARPDTPVAAGTGIPGVPGSNAYAALAWGGDTGWQFGADATYTDKTPVNDTNSEYAPAYTTVGVSGGYVVDRQHWRVHGFARVDNALDRTYVGSVIVNDGNGRYYEPAPGRTFFVGMDLRWRD